MKNIDNFKFISNSEEINGIQLIKVSSKVKTREEYNNLKSQLFQYVDEDFNKEYCLDISKLKKMGDICYILSTMMSFQRYCANKNKQSYFISYPKLDYYLEKSQLINKPFKGKVYKSKEDLEKNLSK